MIEIIIALASAVSLLLGLAIGAWFIYIKLYQPVWSDYQEVVDKLVHMKKQGFVPQFAVEQKTDQDPSDGIVEY